MRSRLLAVGLLVAAAAAAVSRAQAPGADGPPRYEVEVVIFAHGDLDPGEELFAVERAVQPLGQPDALLPAPRPEDLPLAPLDPGNAPTSAAPGAEPPLGGPLAADQEPASDLEVVLDYRTGRRSLRFRPLRPDELRLGAHYQALQRLQAYRPVLHVGWVQEVLAEREAQPFDLALLGVTTPAGSVRVHLARFLHLTLDLRYQPPGSVTEARAPAFGGAFGLDEIPLLPRYEIRTQRRIRSNEINYFDHPAFGVLVVVRPVAAPATAVPGTPRPAA